MILALLSAAALSCTATDGDTIRCGKRSIRVLGIDAPELPGHCRTGRVCAPGDPVASKANMAKLLQGRVVVRGHGKDRYGRTLAHVYSDGQLVACLQLLGGFAIYKPDWDDKPAHFVAKRCHVSA